MDFKRFDKVIVDYGTKTVSGEVRVVSDSEIIVRGVMTEGEPLDRIITAEDIVSGKVKVTKQD